MSCIGPIPDAIRLVRLISIDRELISAPIDWPHVHMHMHMVKNDMKCMPVDHPFRSITKFSYGLRF